MIPKIGERGHSFKGIMAYLLHDPDHATTSERVAWHEIGNLYTNNPEVAARMMARFNYDAANKKEHNTGRKATAGHVYHYSLSWAQGETPDAEHMKHHARDTLERLGLSDHHYIIVAHDDTDHAHVHVVANLVHPDTGKVHSLSWDKRQLQDWALDYEKAHGMHCLKREQNALMREQGITVKHREQKQDYSQLVTEAYTQSDSGSVFRAALKAHGLELAAARRGNGFVIVDQNGDVQKLSRQLDIAAVGKAKTAAINTKLADIDRAALPDADTLAKQTMHRAESPATKRTENATQSLLESPMQATDEPPAWFDAQEPPPDDGMSSHRVLASQENTVAAPSMTQTDKTKATAPKAPTLAGAALRAHTVMQSQTGKTPQSLSTAQQDAQRKAVQHIRAYHAKRPQRPPRHLPRTMPRHPPPIIAILHAIVRGLSGNVARSIDVTLSAIVTTSKLMHSVKRWTHKKASLIYETGLPHMRRTAHPEQPKRALEPELER